MKRVFITGASSGIGAVLSRQYAQQGATLRLEMKPHGIRVVTIAPGYIDTPMTRANPYPMPFLMPAARFAEQAAAAIAAGTSHRVIPWQMGVVAKLLRALPDALYDLAFTRAPRKPRAGTP